MTQQELIALNPWAKYPNYKGVGYRFYYEDTDLIHPLDKEIIEKYKRSVPDFEIDKKEYAPDIDTVLHTDLGVYSEYGPKFPEWFKLHDYQDEAITEWQKRNYRGIFDMATGTGKTLTGLGAISKLSKDSFCFNANFKARS